MPDPGPQLPPDPGPPAPPSAEAVPAPTEPSPEAGSTNLSDQSDQSHPVPAAPPVAAPKPGEPRKLDFRSPSLLSTAELRRARLRHEAFARALATRFSIWLRVEFGVQMTGLQTLPQPRFFESLPDPGHLTLFSLEPLQGLGLLAWPPALSHALVDRLLGGPGQPGNAEQPLTDLDVAVLDHVAGLVVKEWAQTVAGLAEVRPEILGHETHPRFLPVAAEGTQVLALTLEARLGELAEPLHLAFPFAMVEGLLRRPNLPQPAARPAPAEAAEPRWLPALDEVPVQVSAGWDGLQITAQQLARLKVGDVLPLPPQRFEQVQVRVARVGKFVGRLGAARNLRAVELTGTVR